jgi:hypothetical protein
MSGAQMSLEDCIDAIEGSYELMLAYAAQGRDVERIGGDGPPIRCVLGDLRAALGVIAMSFRSRIDVLEQDVAKPFNDFCSVLEADAERAGKAVDLVLATSNIGSQLVDNLNASMHLRALLTDMFLLDEATTTLGRQIHH